MAPVHPDYESALRRELAMYEQAGRDERASAVRDELRRIGADVEPTPAEIEAEKAAADKAAADKAAADKAAAEKKTPPAGK